MDVPPDASRTRKVLKWLWKNYARNAAKRQVPVHWLISLDEFKVLVAANCTYCGVTPSNHRSGVWYSGIDRKDNRKDYTLDNCVPCCRQCNSIKGEHLSYEEMKTAMEAVGRHRRKTPWGS